MVDFFRQQFAALGGPVELYPALGAEPTLQLVQQAERLGGADFILLHPQFLQDKGPNSLVSGGMACGYSRHGRIKRI